MAELNSSVTVVSTDIPKTNTFNLVSHRDLDVGLDVRVQEHQLEKLHDSDIQKEIGHFAPGISVPDTQTTTSRKQESQPSLLIVSPYTSLPHLLDLSTLDIPNRLMALALKTMHSTTTAYASTPYITSFNWPHILTTLQHLCHIHHYTWTHTTFYCVVFTSQLLPSCNYPDLSALDKASHAEAMAGGGFLKYWFGNPRDDKEGKMRNLATCIWRSREDARRGSGGVEHRRAAAAAKGSYDWFEIQRLKFVVGDGVEEWGFESWVD